MNLKSKCRFDALLCIRQFRVLHPEVAAKAAAKAAFDAVDAAIDDILQLASDRLHSTNAFLGASAERQSARAELHEFISDLSRISKTLDRATYPDIAAQLKMGRLNAYQDLLSHARNAIVVITPIKEVFIDHGAPETVIEDIESMINALEVAGNRRNQGLGSQIARNTTLRIAARTAMDHVRVLDGILNITLKRQPGLLAEWKAAMRLRRRGKSADRKVVPDEHQSQPAPIDAVASNSSPREDLVIPALPAPCLTQTASVSNPSSPGRHLPAAKQILSAPLPSHPRWLKP